MLVRGIVLGGLSASGLSLLMVGAVALVAPPPGEPAPDRSAAPAAPQAAAPGSAPETLPAAPPAEVPSQDVAESAPPATGVELPAGSQFGRSTEQVATPATPEAGPSRSAASTPPPAPTAAPEGFAPATDSVQAPDLVVALAPVQGPGDVAADPAAPATVVEGAPTTFRPTGIEGAAEEAGGPEIVVETPGGSLEATEVSDFQAPPRQRPVDDAAEDVEATPPVLAEIAPPAPVPPAETGEEVQIARADPAVSVPSQPPEGLAAVEVGTAPVEVETASAPLAESPAVVSPEAIDAADVDTTAPLAPAPESEIRERAENAVAVAPDAAIPDTVPETALTAETVEAAPQVAPELAESAPAAPVNPPLVIASVPQLTETDAVQSLSPVAELEASPFDDVAVAGATAALPQAGGIGGGLAPSAPDEIALALLPDVPAAPDVDRAGPGALATPTDAGARPAPEGTAQPRPAIDDEATEIARVEPPAQAEDVETAQLIRPVPDEQVLTPAPREEVGPEPAPIVPRVVTPGQPRRILLDSEAGGTGTPATGRADSAGPAAATPAEAEDDTRAISRNAARFEAEGARPLFGVVLIDDGKGVSPDNLAAIDFPVTFALDALDPDAATRAAAYRAAGQEVVLLAEALPADGSPQDFEIALAGALQALPQAVAVLDTPDRRLARNRQSLPALADTGHGLVTHPVGLGSAVNEARRAGVPAAQLYRLLDEDDERATVITRYLDRATFEAAQEGSTIVVGRARPETITALYSWRLGDRSANVELAPLSALLLSED